MSAYLILNFNIDDPEPYAEYNAAAAEAFNIGVPLEMVARDTATENLEGSTGDFTIVIKFQSKQEARKIYDSDAYKALIPKRLAATSNHFAVLVDGT